MPRVVGSPLGSSVELSEITPTIMAQKATTTLTSDTQTVDITGLDINTDGVYIVEAQILNGDGANTSAISIQVEGDTTAANYRVQRLQVNNATLAAARANNSNIQNLAAGKDCNLRITVHRDTAGLIRIIGHSCLDDGVGLQFWEWAVTTEAAKTNLTQLTFTSDRATGMGSGSKFTIGYYG